MCHLKLLVELVRTELIFPSIEIDLAQGKTSSNPQMITIMFCPENCDFQMRQHRNGDHFLKLWQHMLSTHKTVIS